MSITDRRGFLRHTLGAIWTGATVLDQAIFRAARARAQAPLAANQRLFDLVRAGDGVVAALARPAAVLNCNAVIFENERDLLIVDAHSKPSAVAALVQQIRAELTDKPVRYVVATHFHWDHAQGLPGYRWAAPEATLLGSEATRKLMDELSASRLQNSLEQMEKTLEQDRQRLASARTAEERSYWLEMVSGVSAYIAEMRNYKPELPEVTFDRDLVIHDKAGELRLSFRGRAHTAGDVVVYSPRAKVVATGDLIHGFLPYLGDGYPLEYPNTLLRVAEMDFQTIAGGHGDIHRGRGLLYLKRNYIEEITDRVARGRRAGKTLAQLQAEITPATLKSLADGGYGEFVGQSILRHRMVAPPRPPAAALVAEAVKSNVAEIFGAFERPA
jgi:glyoxylase-like metal-dependent hydrolase (beta-lactamase superfamily II)